MFTLTGPNGGDGGAIGRDTETEVYRVITTGRHTAHGPWKKRLGPVATAIWAALMIAVLVSLPGLPQGRDDAVAGTPASAMARERPAIRGSVSVEIELGRPTAIVRPARRPRFMRTARATRAPAPPPAIALIIDDMGLDRARSRRTVTLPAPLTLAYMTYASDLRRQTRAAREAGHELLVHIPMEPVDADADPGPNVLTSSLGRAELLRRIDWSLNRFDNFVGISNHMGSLFTANPQSMELLLDELGQRGLLYVDSRTTRKTVAAAAAREMGVRFAERDVFIDNEPGLDAIRERLRALEARARKKGFAIGIGHPRDATLAVLSSWIGDARRRGFALVPVSEIIERNRPVDFGGLQNSLAARG